MIKFIYDEIYCGWNIHDWWQDGWYDIFVMRLSCVDEIFMVDDKMNDQDLSYVDDKIYLCRRPIDEWLRFIARWMI
jgi:hypothetical protein